MSVAPTTPPPPMNGVSNWPNDLVIVQSVFGGIAAILCIQVLIVLTQSYRLRILHDRLILGVFVHSLSFSIINAVPFDYNDSAGYSNGDYCWWRGWWFASSYGVLMYINLILVAVLWLLMTSKPFKFKFELAGHTIIMCVFVACLAGFVGKCSYIYRNNYEASNDDQGGAQGDAIVRVFQPMMKTWVALVLIGVVLYLWTWRYTTTLERQWLHYEKSLEFLEDEQLRSDERDSGSITLKQYAMVVRPLRHYPVVFFAFGLPAIAFFADNCYDSLQCLHSIEFVMSLRTFPIYVSFLLSSPRNWLEARSVHIILAKRFGFTMLLDRDQADHYGRHGSGSSSQLTEMDSADDYKGDTDVVGSSVEYNAFKDDNNLLRSWTMDQPHVRNNNDNLGIYSTL